jgi:isopenicillin-N epimerase
MLEPGVDHLNHGSFGATPRVVLAAQQAWRDRIEVEPVRFLARDVEGYLDHAREELGQFLGADPDDLAFVPNATAGFNAVLRSLVFEPGDELLTTDHAYNAAKNVLEWVAARSGARVVVASVPFPIQGPEEVRWSSRLGRNGPKAAPGSVWYA